MIKDVQLSKNFWLSELVKSSTADRLKIDNWPQEEWVVDNLRNVAENILQPVRNHFGRSIRPSSGFRCLALNRVLNSKDTSQHILGQAVDFEIAGLANKEVAEWIRDHCDFDQLILEFWYDNNPNSGWIHGSYVNTSTNRNTTLTINRNGTFVGFQSS